MSVANEYGKPAIIAVIGTVIGLMLGNWNNSLLNFSDKANNAASSDEVHSLETTINKMPSKEWMLDQFASKSDVQNWSYRTQRLEKDYETLDGRQRRNTDIVNRLCQIHKNDIVCSSQNAIWRMPPSPSSIGPLKFVRVPPVPYRRDYMLFLPMIVRSQWQT